MAALIVTRAPPEKTGHQPSPDRRGANEIIVNGRMIPEARDISKVRRNFGLVELRKASTETNITFREISMTARIISMRHVITAPAISIPSVRAVVAIPVYAMRRGSGATLVEVRSNENATYVFKQLTEGRSYEINFSGWSIP